MRATSEEHPEDLLDVISRGGQLSEVQERVLRPHLADCFVCATQMKMVERKQRDHRSTSAAYLDRVAVLSAMQRLDAPTPRLRAAVARRWWAVAAGMLLLSSSALAATWWSLHREASPPAHVPVSEAATPRAAAPKPALIAPPSDEDVLDNSVEPPALIDDRSAGTVGRLGDRNGAAALFARARELRLAGKPAAALVLYQRLQARYAHSAESHLSYIIVGRLWLATGKAELAAQQFALYLRAGGNAAEEALVGHATALSRLGRTAEEAADWRTLSRRFPESVYAGQARTRLAAIDAKVHAAALDRGQP